MIYSRLKTYISDFIVEFRIRQTEYNEVSISCTDKRGNAIIYICKFTDVDSMVCNCIVTSLRELVGATSKMRILQF